MQASNWINSLLSQLWVLPELLVCVIGLVACIVFMPRYPKPAVWGLAGFVILIVCVLSGSLVQFWIITANQRGRGVSQLGMILSLIGLARAVGFATGLAMLITAIFIDRGRPDSPWPQK